MDTCLIISATNQTYHGANFQNEIYDLNIMFVIHFPLILLSNSLIVATVWLFRFLESPDNYIIGAIAVADLITGVIALPSLIFFNGNAQFQSMVKHSITSCSIGWISISYGPTTALTMLTFMTFQRYLAINYPCWYTQNVSVGSVRCRVFILFTAHLIYEVSFFSMCPPYNEHQNTSLYLQCTSEYLTPWYSYVRIGSTWIKLILGLSFTVQVVFVSRKHLRRQKSRRKSLNLNGYNSLQTGHQISHVKITTQLMFLYIVIWIPVAATLIAHAISEDRQLIILVSMIGWHGVFTSSWTNAVVYYRTKSTYRHAFKFLLTTAPWKWKTFRLAKWASHHASTGDRKTSNKQPNKDDSLVYEKPSYLDRLMQNQKDLEDDICFELESSKKSLTTDKSETSNTTEQSTLKSSDHKRASLWATIREHII